jgi:protein-tyrosine sulfotransferase
MCRLLDQDVNIRCSDNYGLVSEMIFRHDEWTNSKIEKERLKHASMTDNVIDGAMIAFILDLVLKQGKVAPRICNKDNRIMNHAPYTKILFPNVKFIFMIRDARATANTIVNKRIQLNGAKINSHKDALINWNKLIDKMYKNCAEVGFDTCMPVYYEKLLMEPEITIQQVYKFINLNFTQTQNNAKNDKIIIDKTKLNSWYSQFPSKKFNLIFFYIFID